jgi:predicted nucleic acid-binding protein
VLLLDNSAWSRVVQGALEQKRDAQIAEWIEQRELATSLPFLLEAGYSARSAVDHNAKMADLELLPCIRVTVAIEERALAAQSELASIGHHRLAPIDIVIAACAHEAEAGVLHYDRDYDILAEHTSLDFQSEWVAPPGTL